MPIRKTAAGFVRRFEVADVQRESTTLTQTSSHGFLNQIYYPGIDQASIRNLNLNVPDRHSALSEAKRDTKNIIWSIVARVPAVATSHDGGASEIESRLLMMVRY
jgi:Glucodextranase, domain N